MTFIPLRRTATVTVLATLAAVLSTAPSALAGPPEPALQQHINAHLRAYPGGRQINAREISYRNGAFIITFAPAVRTLAGPDCPSSWYCFYDGINYGYPRGKLSSCGWQDLMWWGWHDRTESVHYNLPTGSVSFSNHGSGSNHTGDTFLFNISTANRARPDNIPSSEQSRPRLPVLLGLDPDSRTRAD